MDARSFYEYLLSKGYDRRESQEAFIDLVDELIGSGGVKLIEAPTGTGKTFGYLIPIIASGEKAIVSTGTKILQDQLRRDIEFLSGHYKLLTGKEVNYLVVKGKGNYLCLDRFKREDVDPMTKASLEGLLERGWDGDLSLTDLSTEVMHKVNIDEDYCTYAYKQVCPHKSECLYWSLLKSREHKAQVLVVNHALLALKEFEATEERILVIDEAHELDRYLTLASTGGVSLYAVRELIGSLGKLLNKELPITPEEFFKSNFEGLFSEESRDVSLESLSPYMDSFEEQVYTPLRGYFKEFRETLRTEVVDFLESRLMISFKLKNYLINSMVLPPEEVERFKATYEDPEEEELKLIERLKKFEFLDSRLYKLGVFIKQAREDSPEYGYRVSRKWSSKLQTYNYKMEIFPVFPRGVLSTEEYKGVLLTSATVDPEDISFTTGIKGEFHKLSKNFDYSRVHFIVKRTNPKRSGWREELLESYRKLLSLYDRILVLLTNRSHMELFENTEGVAMQGEGGLDSLVNKLRDGKIKVLIGLDSLWTGIDVRGEKGILMSKLPFDSPEDPVTYHRLRYLESIGEDPFTYQRRKAFIKFRQGVGRLMRQKEDKGTIILCDNRIWRYREFVNFLKELGVNLVSESQLTYRRT